MGIFGSRARAGFPLLRRIGQALFAEGGTIEMPPTERGGEPTTVPVPKGILRSRSVVASIVTVIFAVLSVFGIDVEESTGVSEDAIQQTLMTFASITAGLAGFFRVKASNMTRG